MATIPVLGNPDLGNREIVNTLLQKLTADPGSPVEAFFFYRDDTDRVRVRAAGAWKDLAYTDDIVTPTIADHSVTNAMMTQMPANSVKANITGSTADQANVTLANFKTWLALSLSDITGEGTLAALNSITTGNIDNNAITVAKMQQVAAHSILANITGSTADLTVVTRDALIQWMDDAAQFTTSVMAAVNASTVDADTVNGSTASQIATSAIDTIRNGVGAAYDTLLEIKAELDADDTLFSTLSSTKNKAGVAADLGTSSADAVHNHALNTRDVLCQLVRKADWKHVIAPYTITDVNNVTWNLDAAPTAAQYRSIIIPASAT